MRTELKNKKRQAAQRQSRIRAKVKGNDARPRLSVFRSNRFIYAQIINDERGTTLAAANSKQTGSVEETGKAIATAALAAGVKQVVFDRGQFTYTGNIKKLAEAARAGGLDF